MPRTATAKLVPATEAQEQRAMVAWIRTQPKIRGFIVKLNNEGKRTPAQGWNLKMLGMCVGASDLFLSYPIQHVDGSWSHGFWLEMKCNRKYAPSERERNGWINQILFHRKMRAIGYACAFAYGWEQGRELILKYLRGEIVGVVE